MNTQTLLFIPVIYLLVVSLPIVVSDLRVARVPNKYTLPSLYLWLICAGTYVVFSGDYKIWLGSFVLPFICGVATLVAGVYFSGRKWIGMGDVKLFVFMGLSLSWKSAWVWLLIPAGSLLIALIVFVIYYFAGKFDKPTYIRLAPAVYVVYLVITATLFLN